MTRKAKTAVKQQPEALTAGTDIARTSQGLRDALFQEMNALRAGESNPARARSLAMVANSILHSVSIEIEYHKYVSSVTNTVAGTNKLGSLALSGTLEPVALRPQH